MGARVQVFACVHMCVHMYAKSNGLSQTWCGQSTSKKRHTSQQQMRHYSLPWLTVIASAYCLEQRGLYCMYIIRVFTQVIVNKASFHYLRLKTGTGTKSSSCENSAAFHCECSILLSLLKWTCCSNLQIMYVHTYIHTCNQWMTYIRNNTHAAVLRVS